MELTDDLLNLVWYRLTGKPEDTIGPIKGFYMVEDRELIIVFKRKGENLPAHTINDAIILEDGELDAMLEQVPELKSAIVLAGIVGDDATMSEEDQAGAGLPTARHWRDYWKARQRIERGGYEIE